MLFETLIYKCILKARSIARRDNKDRIKLNGSVHYLIDKCFFNSQLMTIRRLTDKGPDVVSLRKLLNRMKQKCEYFTRQNYFSICLGSLYTYDYSNIKKRHDEYVDENLRMGEVIVIPEELDWERSASAHYDFDKLSKSNAENRRPEDMIDNAIFDRLLEELGCCAGLRKHVDHFLAHCLNERKVEALDDESLRVTYGHLWKAQEAICKVTKFIGLYLLNRTDYGLLVMPHGNFLRYIEEPLISKEGKVELREEEGRFREEVRSWRIEIADLCG